MILSNPLSAGQVSFPVRSSGIRAGSARQAPVGFRGRKTGGLGQLAGRRSLAAGMLPLADALEKTGGTKLVVAALMKGVGDGGPRMMLTVIFFLTAALDS